MNIILNRLSTKLNYILRTPIIFLFKLDALPSLPEDIISCTLDVVGLYPNIPHEDGLVAMRITLDEREDETLSTDSLIELVECVLKNNMFEHNTSFYKQIRGTAIGTKMAPPFAIIFVGDVEGKILEDCDKKTLTWW